MKVNIHTNNQQNKPKIGQYHYSMFYSSYGSPIYLTQYKLEYAFVFIYWVYITFTVAFDEYPAQNSVTDQISFDNRPIYIIYWGPTILYLCLSIFAISDFFTSNRFYIYIYGIIVYLWHLAYFIIFWVSPSVMLPKSINEMQAAAGYYWSELVMNMIMIIFQCGNSQANMHYPAVMEEQVNKVNDSIAGYFAVELVEEPEVHDGPLSQ